MTASSAPAPPARRAVAVAAGLVAALGILVAAKNVAAKAALLTGVRAVTGLAADAAMVDVGLVSTAVGITGLRVYGPPGFPDRAMADIPEIYVNYKVLPLFRGRVHLETVRLHLRELTVVKRADGAVNVKAIKAMQPGKAKQAAQQQEGRQTSNFQIDRLEIKIGKVVYKDYTRGPAPVVREFNANIDERYERVTNPTIFASLVVTRALVKTAVGRLAGVDTTALQNDISDAMRRSSQALDRVVQAAGRRGGKRLLNETGDAIEGAANLLTGAFRKRRP